MAISVVQSATVFVTGAGSAAASLTGVTTGNMLLAWLSAYPGGTVTATCTDNQGNTYTQSYGQNDTGTGVMIFGWYAKNVTGGSVTITVDPAGASSDITMVVAEIAGADTTTPADQVNTARNNSTTPSVAVTTATANEGYFACVTHDGTDRTITQAGGWTVVREDEGGSTHMPISVIWQTAAAGTITASWTFGTGAVNWVCGLASFKEAAGAPAGFIPSRGPSAVYRM